ncbi:MAG: aspartyl protease family protein [Verrucomicrobia bacterium]|nr:aspartyl protease family protein [Verrucomicrobiota bacterium]
MAGSEQPLNFLFDTGAEVSVLDLNAAKRIGLLLGPRVSVRGVCAAMTGHWPQTVSASAQGVSLPSEYLVLDLSKLGRACEKRVDGLIGMDFIRDRIVQIDFDASRIRLLKPEDLPASARRLPLEVRRCGMRVKSGINGNKAQWLRVDTGCASALQWVTASVRPGECGGKLAIGLAEMNIPQTRTTVELGGQTFRNVPTGLHREAIFAGESGLLGNGLLSRFGSVVIDAQAGSLLLGPVRQAD